MSTFWSFLNRFWCFPENVSNLKLGSFPQTEMFSDRRSCWRWMNEWMNVCRSEHEATGEKSENVRLDERNEAADVWWPASRPTRLKAKRRHPLNKGNSRTQSPGAHLYKTNMLSETWRHEGRSSSSSRRSDLITNQEVKNFR